MGEWLLHCTMCKEEKWFSVEEYSKDHIIISCDDCGVRIYSDLTFKVVVE